MVVRLAEAGHAALRAAKPEVERFHAELRALLGADGFAGTAAALHDVAHWQP